MIYSFSNFTKFSIYSKTVSLNFLLDKSLFENIYNLLLYKINEK